MRELSSGHFCTGVCGSTEHRSGHIVSQRGKKSQAAPSCTARRASVAQWPTLCNPRDCDPMNRSTPGLPVHHQLPESTHTHVHRVGDASSHLLLCLSSPPPPAPNPSRIRVFSTESALPIRKPCPRRAKCSEDSSCIFL